MSLQAGVVRSVRITLAATVVTGLTQAVLLVVLARLLTPADYGAMAAILVFVRPMQAVLFNGLERTLVLRRDDESPLDATTAWFCIAIGGASGAAMTLLAIGMMATMETLRPGLILLSIVPALVVAGINVPSRAALRRRMEFRRLAVSDVAGLVIGLGAVTVGAALLGWGPFALAAGIVAQTVIQAALNFASARLDLSGRIDRAIVGDLARRAFLISRLSIAEIVHLQLVPAFVGWRLGTLMLGYFNRAYSLIQLPIEMLGTSLSRVLVSGFVTAQDDVERLRRGCRAMIEIGALATVPLCLGMAGARHEVVAVVLGAQWTKIVPLIPPLAVGTAAYLLGQLLAVLNESVGRVAEKLRFQLVTSAITVTGLALFGTRGLEAVSAVFAVGAVSFLLFQAWIAGDALAMPRLRIVGWTLPAVVCGGLLWAFSQSLHTLSSAEKSPMTLAAQVIGCALIAATYYFLFFRKTAFAALTYVGIGRQGRT